MIYIVNNYIYNKNVENKLAIRTRIRTITIVIILIFL